MDADQRAPCRAAPSLFAYFAASQSSPMPMSRAALSMVLGAVFVKSSQLLLEGPGPVDLPAVLPRRELVLGVRVVVEAHDVDPGPPERERDPPGPRSDRASTPG